jgi:hypothetical protein
MKAAAVTLDGARAGGGRVVLGGAEHTVVTPSLHVRVADHVEALPADALDRAAAAFDRILAASSAEGVAATAAEAAGADGARPSPLPAGAALGARGRSARPAEPRVPRGGSCAQRGQRGSRVAGPAAASVALPAGAT